MNRLIYSVLFLALAAGLLLSAGSASAAERRVLMVVTSHSLLGSTGEQTGAWLAEVTHPYYEFVDSGFTVTFVSPQGGEPPVDPRSLGADDPTNTRFLQDSVAQDLFSHSLPPDSVAAKNFDIVFFCGGHGTMWDFPDNERLATVTSEIYEAGGVVGAVCHGPAALVDVTLSDGTYLIDGMTVTAFTNEEERARGLQDVVPFLLESRLRERGAEFDGAENWQENVVVSDRLVTGQNPASAREAALACIRAYKSGE